MTPKAHSVLLIHGALFGAWCWDRVLPILADEGHDVHAIDLPGHGEDRTKPEGLRQRDYTDAVVRYCERHDLRDLVLVGHSAAGATLTLVAPLLTERISSMVFLAALVPAAGQSLMQLVAPSRLEEYKRQQRQPGGQSFLPDRDRAYAMFLEGLAPEEQERAWLRLRPEPLGPYLEPIRNAPLDHTGYDLHYLACVNDVAIQLSDQELYAQRLGVIPRTVGGGHCPMLSSPGHLAGKLLECL